MNYQINSSKKLQQILGYGAGLPQASAKVLIDLKRRNEKLYGYTMNKLFGSKNDGAGINILRFPMGSSDFSIVNTSYDEHTTIILYSIFKLIRTVCLL